MMQPTEEAYRHWHEEGYLVFENAIQGEELARLQSAFDHWAAVCKEDWLLSIERGEASATFYDIPNVLKKDEVFIDLVDHPGFYGHLMAFTDNDLIFVGPQARTVPPWVISYTDWHPDVAPDHPLHIKVQIYINDVESNSGEFAYVPGSHKPGAGPYSRVHNPAAMPGHKRFTGKAGTAIMFNSYGWHVAMDNHTSVPRKSIILIYERRTPGRVEPGKFAAITSSANTPDRRRLFSLV